MQGSFVDTAFVRRIRGAHIARSALSIAITMPEKIVRRVVRIKLLSFAYPQIFMCAVFAVRFLFGLCQALIRCLIEHLT